jgi:hypothetical protein
MNHIQTLKDYNAWRRGDESLEQPDPKVIGEAIDWAISYIEAVDESMKNPSMQVAAMIAGVSLP